VIDSSIAGYIPHILFLAFSIPIAIIDIRCLKIPDKLVYPCFGLLLCSIVIFEPSRLPDSLIAAAIGFIMFFCIRIFTKGMGFGDVKLAAVIGLYCGIPGVFIAFIAAAAFGIIFGIFFLIRRKTLENVLIPFAPFLVGGAVVEQILMITGVVTKIF